MHDIYAIRKINKQKFVENPAGNLDKPNSGGRARAAWIKRTDTDAAFEREVDRSQRMLERLFGFNEDDLK